MLQSGVAPVIKNDFATHKTGRTVMKQTVLKVHPKDNVLVALKNLSKGETVQYDEEKYVFS